MCLAAPAADPTAVAASVRLATELCTRSVCGVALCHARGAARPGPAPGKCVSVRLLIRQANGNVRPPGLRTAVKTGGSWWSQTTRLHSTAV